MQEKTVFLTGATSFTGAHIARAFSDAGFHVVGTILRDFDNCEDPLTKTRIEHSKISDWVYDAPFGSDKLVASIAEKKPQIFINHGASIRGYRSPDFDYLGSISRSLNNVQAVFAELKKQNCELIIHTGSIFERGEGSLAEDTEALTVYGLCKTMVWDGIRYFAHVERLRVSEVVIPNPVGPMENIDRLIPDFITSWKKGETPVLKAPALIRDNIPAPWLANVYLEEAKHVLTRNERVRILRPSAYVLSNKDFIELFIRKAKEYGTRLNLDLEIKPAPTSVPLKRINSDPVPEKKDPEKVDLFWKTWFENLELI